MTNKAITSCMLILLPAGLLWAAEQVRVSVDPEARKQAEIAVREAQQNGNAAATLRACRRWLEFYPNEPIVQAGIYRAMALVAEESGDAPQAQVWATTARQLDPAFELALQDDASITRGGADKLAAALAGVAATAQTVQQVRAAVSLKSPLAPQPTAAFPPQPVGAPGYQAQPSMQPMPGYAPQPYAQSGVAQPAPMYQPQQQVIPQPLPQPIPQPAAGGPFSNPIPQPIPQPVAVDPFGNPIPQPMAVDPFGNPIPQPAGQMIPQPLALDPLGNPIPQPVPQMIPQPVAVDPFGNPMPPFAAQPVGQPTSQAMPPQMPQPLQQVIPQQMIQPMPQGVPPQLAPPTVQPMTQGAAPQMVQQIQQGVPQPVPQQIPQAPSQIAPPVASLPTASQPMPQQQQARVPYAQGTQGYPSQQPVYSQQPPSQAYATQPPIYPQRQAAQQYTPQQVPVNRGQTGWSAPNGRPSPYSAPASYARPRQVRRGEAAKAIRVFHDHSRLGDDAYFDPPCAALIVVEGGTLTFTPSGGEGPLLIPAADILEIRVNVAVGKEAGAFHILTTQGLYLDLAPEGATSDEGRADVEQLRQQLGVDQ